MSDYPSAVAAIVADYLDRVRTLVPPAAALERDELSKELQSHVYEAYQQMPGSDEVARILSVLRKLGEPADVVSDRLPQAIVRSGAAHQLPLQILGGIVIALFGIPLGFAGVATLAGMLVSLAGVLVAYYATAGATLLTGAVCVALGLVRIYGPELWEKFVAAGVVNIPPQLAELLDQVSPVALGLLLLLSGTLLVGMAAAMLWLGGRLARGLRFVFVLAWDGARRLAQSARGTLRTQMPSGHHAAGEPATRPRLATPDSGRG